jgi:hypothetical protein
LVSTLRNNTIRIFAFVSYFTGLILGFEIGHITKIISSWKVDMINWGWNILILYILNLYFNFSQKMGVDTDTYRKLIIILFKLLVLF